VQNLVTEDLSVRAAHAADEEERFFLEALRRLRRNPPTVGDTPVTVISGMQSTIFDRPIREAFMRAHRQTATRTAHVTSPQCTRIIKWS